MVVSSASLGSINHMPEIRHEVHSLAKSAKELGRLHDEKGPISFHFISSRRIFNSNYIDKYELITISFISSLMYCFIVSAFRQDSDRRGRVRPYSCPYCRTTAGRCAPTASRHHCGSSFRPSVDRRRAHAVPTIRRLIGPSCRRSWTLIRLTSSITVRIRRLTATEAMRRDVSISLPLTLRWRSL